MNLASVLCETQKSDEAFQLYTDCLTILEQPGRENHNHYHSAIINANLGVIASLNGRPNDAEQFLFQSLSVLESNKIDEGNLLYIKIQNNLAVVFCSLDKLDASEQLGRAALVAAEKFFPADHPGMSTILDNLAIVLQKQGQFSKAEKFSKRSCEGCGSFLNHLSSSLSERGQLIALAKFRHSLDIYCALALAGSASPRSVWSEVVALKGSVLARQRMARLLASSNPALQANLTKLVRLSSELSASLEQGPADESKLELWRKKIESLSAEKERVEAEMYRASAEARTVLQLPSAEDIRQAIPENAVLVDLLVCGADTDEPSLAAFIVRRDGEIKLIDLGSVAETAGLIRQWRSWYAVHPSHRPASAESRQASDTAGQELRKRIWEPIEPHLGGAEVVLVSPDGPLCLFPLPALPGSKPGTYLIEECSVAILPAPQLLPELLTPTSSPQAADAGVLVVGDIDYGPTQAIAAAASETKSPIITSSSQGQDGKEADVRSDQIKHIASQGSRANSLFSPRGVLRGHNDHWEWGELINSKHEVNTVVSMLSDEYGASKVNTLVGREATEDAFIELAPQSRVLHVCTHGYFAPAKYRSVLAPAERFEQVPLDSKSKFIGLSPGLLSGLVFVDANLPGTGARDGILTAEEIAALNLSNVDLAVLSACETGLGEEAGGEGLLGLQRAFQVAGAKTTVATLWQVADQETSDLIGRFYKNRILQKEGKLTALQNAQGWLLNIQPEANLAKRTRGLEPEGTRTAGASTPGDPALARTDPYFWAAFVLSGDWR